MRNNTQYSEYDEKQSLSTKVSAPTKSASFTVNAKRQMFLQKTNKDNQIQKINNNVLALSPQSSAFVISDKVMTLDDENQFVLIQDGFYTLFIDRSKPRMISRTVQPKSQLLFCESKKPGANIVLESLHYYSNQDYPSMIHVNISRYNPDQYKLEAKNIHLPIQPQCKILSFLTLQNSKKCLLLTQNPSTQTLQFIYFSLAKDNKHKNIHFKYNKTKLKQFGQISSDEQDEEGLKKKQIDKQYIVQELQTVRKSIPIKFPNNQNQKFLELINSQYGDALLFVTNKEIYNIQIQGKQILLNSIKIQDQIKAFKSKMDLNDDNSNKDQSLLDVSYILNGLKVMFITANNILGYISAQKIISLTNLEKQLGKKEKFQKYRHNLTIKKIYPMIEKLILQTDNNQLIVCKQQQRSHKINISIDRVIDIILDKQTDLYGYKMNTVPKNDEIIISKIVSNLEKKTSSLEIGKKSLISPGNQFTSMYTSGYFQYNSKKLAENQRYSYQRTPSIAEANGICCLINGSQVSFIRIYQGFTTQKNTIQELFGVTFFQRPLKVSINPYGSKVIILFKQFVKFFQFQYQCLEQYYTYNVRGVHYAGFCDSGQYIMVAVDDQLYFLNPYTFKTQRCMEAYGEVKNIKYFDTSLYILLKNKLATKSSSQLLIQCYLQKDGQFEQVSQIKIQAEQAYYMDRKFLIIASKKCIKVYYYDYFEQQSQQFQTNSRKQKLFKKQISLLDYYEYPTAITLSQQFGVLLIGTNYGKIYQYLWPFDNQNTQYATNQFHVTAANNREIIQIRIGTCLQKIITFTKNGMITQLDVNQHIQSEQMTTPYVISANTLYGTQLKYQFASRQYLYQNHTSYIQQYRREGSELIEQLRFVQQKIADDIEQQNIKANNQLKMSINQIESLKNKDTNEIQKQFKQNETSLAHNKKNLYEKMQQVIKTNQQNMKNLTDNYQKKMLELYKQADRLKNIQNQLRNRFRRQKDNYIIQNDKLQENLTQQYGRQLIKYQQKFGNIDKSAKQYQKYVAIQNQERQIQLNQYKVYRHQQIQADLQMEEHLKENLLGSIQQYVKDINNYKQRKDQFESLSMQTNLQIDQLYKDRKSYQEKKTYLAQQLQQKQNMIEGKQKQLIVFVKNTQMMKKIKNTHQFELNQYEKEFEPMNVKIREIENKIKDLNGEIFKQFNHRQNNQQKIQEAKNNIYQKKRFKEQKILKKHTSNTKVNRLLSEIQKLLEKDPLSLELRRKLNDLVNGQTFETNEEEILQKQKNTKLMRKKDFIRKGIQQEQKKQQQIVRNKNLYFHYYNDNTSLVSYYNDLKQEQNKLLAKKDKILANIDDIRRKIATQTPQKLNRTDSGRSHSLLPPQKKYSEKLLTPYQRYQQEQTELIWAKGNTEETRLGSISSRKNLQSNSLLHTLVKDMGKSESAYEKMEVVREKVRSFVNPELRIRNTKKNNMNVQKVLFETRKLVKEEGIQ